MNDAVNSFPLISIILVLGLLYSGISILKPLRPFKRRWQALVCVSLAIVSLALTGSLMQKLTEKTSSVMQYLELGSTDPETEIPAENISPVVQSSEFESIVSKTAATIQDEKIKCDVFDVELFIKNDDLLISLDTDCPDYSKIVTSVYRIFYELGTTNSYSRNYFQETSTVGDWRTQRVISVAHETWIADLETHRQEMIRFGSGFIVGRVSDDIEISMVIPIDQADKRFGHRNSNLVGKAVDITGLRIVKSEVSINYPVREMPDLTATHPSLNSNTLDLNQSYGISKKTPLMSELNPVDSMAALAKTIYLEARSVIGIKGVSTMHGNPWYNVDASDAAGRYVGTGWINSIALLGQDLELFPPMNETDNIALPSQNLEPLPPKDVTEGMAFTKRAQRMLSELGYEPGPIDGIMGLKTKSAIRAFQETNGMRVDGTITDELVDAMLSLSAEIAPKVVDDEQQEQTPSAACPTLDKDGLVEVAQWLDMGVSDDNIGALFKIAPACAKQWREAVER